jgi:hypothetical protein
MPKTYFAEWDNELEHHQRRLEAMLEYIESISTSAFQEVEQ